MNWFPEDYGMMILIACIPIGVILTGIYGIVKLLQGC